MKLTIVIVLAIALIGLKIYMARKKGIKKVISQKLIVLGVIGTISGMVWLVNPDYQMPNPKEIVTEYVSEFLEN